ncbi:hypothetical protein [Streptomyces sp. NPDC019224]
MQPDSAAPGAPDDATGDLHPLVHDGLDDFPDDDDVDDAAHDALEPL